MLICILKGGVMFLTDLMRQISVPHEIDFLAVSSYGRGGRSATGNVRIDMDLKEGVTGKDLLIVEDIIDSGYTLRFVMDMLQARQSRQHQAVYAAEQKQPPRDRHSGRLRRLRDRGQIRLWLWAGFGREVSQPAVYRRGAAGGAEQ